MICPKCHTVNDDEEKYCRECGFQLNSARICPTCGKTNDSNSKYCKECGTVLTPVNTFRKQIIEENTKKSFFSLYKVPIICALVILLAIGAVTGMAYYNGGSGGDDGFSTIIPTDDNGFWGDDVNNDPTQAQMQEDDNKTNETNNQTNDTNASKTLTAKVDNNTNQTKNLTSAVNKTKNQTNSSKSLSNSSSKNNSSKTITEKVNKTDKTKTDKNPVSSSNDSGSSIIPGIFGNDSKDELDDSVNDSNEESDDALNDTLNDSDDSDADDLEDSLTEIEMEDVPNLAQMVSQKNYEFSTIDYNGNEYTEAQCIDIFSQYLLNIDKNENSSIEIKDVKNASNPSGEDLSQSIEETDYLSIAQRVHTWIDQKDTVPNYVGISGVGEADLSPKMMLKLFTLATLEYSITEELPESVEI